jgi:hypothetical protein
MKFTTALRPRLPTLLACLLCAVGSHAQTSTATPTPTQPLRWEVAVVNPNATFYIAPQTVRRQGDLRRFSSLLDYRQPQVTYDGKAFVSTQSDITVHCSDWTAQVSLVVYYSGHMLGGQQVYRDTEATEWKDILAQSPMERMARKLC